MTVRVYKKDFKVLDHISEHYHIHINCKWYGGLIETDVTNFNNWVNLEFETKTDLNHFIFEMESAIKKLKEIQ
jgi:hypothetical protein